MAEKVVRYPFHQGKKHGRKRKFVVSLLLCFIFTGVCLCLGQTYAIREAGNELLELENQRDALRKENELLREEAMLLHDNEYLEIQARKQLGMVRPGEIIFFVGE